MTAVDFILAFNIMTYKFCLHMNVAKKNKNYSTIKKHKTFY